MSTSWKTSVATIIAAIGMTASAFAQDAVAPAPSADAPAASTAVSETSAPVTSGAPVPTDTTAQNADPAAAQPAAPVVAATPNPDGCFMPPAKLSSSEVDAFMANPSGIYDVYGRSSVGLSNRVRGLAGSDPRTLQPILGLIPAANADRRAAIGSGLGRAAFACARTDVVYAQDIQTKMADLNAPEVLAAFLTASNDVQVASLGAGATGGGGPAAGLSGSGNAGPFSAGLGGDEVVPQTVETYTFNGNRLIQIDDNNDDNDDVSPATSN